MKTLTQNVEIKKLDTLSIRALRYKVLWPHKNGIEACVIEPDNLPTTFHMGAIFNGKIVGTSTFIVDINEKFEEKNQYRLRAMATDPVVRGKGVGVKIIEAGIEELKNKNVKLLWCDARIIATGFYEKLNFKVLGDIYQVPDIGPHKLMYLEL